ncbi:MAG: M55 family metallopeptidase [Rhodopirellula sp.]|nr:M55 family metallopeptidase [Rhodopirellula sp.]
MEVNAAIEGFVRGGATDFLVADGHGHAAIHPKLLDSRALLARNWARPAQAHPAIVSAPPTPPTGNSDSRGTKTRTAADRKCDRCFSSDA